MQKPIIKNKWTYEITKNHGKGFEGYGFKLDVYINDTLVFSNDRYGSEEGAKNEARDYFLGYEFGIDRSDE